MKLTLMFSTLLVAAALLLAPPIPKEVKDVPQGVIEIVYHTEDEKGEPMTAVCSAFYVDLVHLITAQHCVPQNGEELRNAESGELLRVVREVKEELALLESQVTDVRPLKLANKVEVGDTLWVFGYAYGEVFVGFQRHAAGKYKGHLIIDGPLAHGMSGGPVVNEAGEVVGVNQGTTVESGFICLVPEIKDILRGK